MCRPSPHCGATTANGKSGVIGVTAAIALVVCGCGSDHIGEDTDSITGSALQESTTESALQESTTESALQKAIAESVPQESTTESALQKAIAESVPQGRTPTPARTYYVEFTDGVRTHTAKWDQQVEVSRFDSPAARPVESQPTQRMSPQLETDILNLARGALADRTVTVLITFREDRKLPIFPEPDFRLSRDAAFNVAVREETESLVRDIERARAPGLDRIATDLRDNTGAEEVERFWLTKSMAMKMPLSSIPGLLDRANLQYVGYAQSGEPPPAYGYVREGRTVLNSDSIRAQWGWFGLIDSGVRPTHQLLSNRIAYWRDCVNGTANNCTSGSNLNPNDLFDHGTGSANILSGNLVSGWWGDNYRGATDILVDSWKVYNSINGYDALAGPRAIEAALLSQNKVIVAEIQADQPYYGSISTKADSAFDRGAVVVAAAGNFGTVRAPGNAKKVLAVGAVDVHSGVLEANSGRGPTTDNRIKPDITGPTGVYVASSASDLATTHFAGTSCATPFVAGLAFNARNEFFDWTGRDRIEPGQVYALLLMTGPRITPTNDVGVGLPTLEPDGEFWNMIVPAVQHGYFYDVLIPITGPFASPGHVKVAIWWPEPTFTHNQIDLALLRPNGTTAESTLPTPDGVFKKVSATTGLATGWWTVRLFGISVAAPQKVYVAVHRR